MKKFLSVVCALGMGLSLFGCGETGNPPTPGKEKVIVSAVKHKENGEGYLEVDGKPFVYLGVESRLDAYMNCEKKTVEEFEPHVKAAADLGASVIAVPIDWRDLEPQKDDYDFRIVSALLGFANKYDIRIEFCWYSVNMCGESNSYQVPAYIWEDEATYPKYDSSNKNVFWGYYGNQGYLRATEALMERETKMIGKLMDYVYNWDLNNGEKHPLIGIQVYNEPDGYPRWRVSQQNISLGGTRITEDQAWQDVYTLLDNAGKAFKSAKYSVYTRTNLTVLTESTKFAETIYNLDGIDAVGNDPYVQSVGAIKNTFADFSANMKGNFNHIAENKGIYTNSPGLILAAAYSGAGYILYDLSTPLYFINNTNDPSTIDHGVLNADLTDREHTEAVRRTINALKGAGEASVLADRKDFALLNLAGSYPERQCAQEIDTTHVSVKFRTEKGAVGFAICYNGYVYAFATDDAELELGNGAFSQAEYGSFGADGWNASGEVEANGNGYALTGGKLCRIKADGTEKLLVSNTDQMIGG